LCSQKTPTTEASKGRRNGYLDILKDSDFGLYLTKFSKVVMQEKDVKNYLNKKITT
jgi:hypothetical protein